MRAADVPAPFWLATVLGACAFACACSVVQEPARSADAPSAQPLSPTQAQPLPAAQHVPDASTALANRAVASDAPAALSPKAATPLVVDPLAAVLSLAPSASTSRGGPSSGELVGGIELPERGPGYRHNPKRPAGARFGTVELISAIVRAAAVVDHELPGSELTVNDLSLHAGGPIAQHGSHQNGRDADILFYVLDAQDKPIPSVGVPLDPQGKGWDFKDLRVPGDDQRVQLDAPRTWRFMHALLEAAPDAVQRIFLVEHLRTRLLAQADLVNAPKAIRERFADVTCQPSTPHDDHMHVRFFCTPEDLSEGCFDSRPAYPFRVQQLQALGLAPVFAPPSTRAQRKAKTARTTTPEQARKRAGPMHAHVRAFLAQRAAWLPQPHPGRPYCR